VALRVVSSQSSTQVERKRAEDRLVFPFRNLAANLLRIVRGAGRPEHLGPQLAACLEALEEHRAVTGQYPKPKVFRTLLNLRAFNFNPDKWADDREREANLQLSMSGYPEKVEAEKLIHRGALQVAASRLLYQHTQEIAGEHEMYKGVHLLKESLAVQSIYWRRRMARAEALEPTVEDEEKPPTP
jgi:hypothetical protein